MLSQSEAVIYLADQRGCTESELHRSFHTFNFGEYYRNDRLPFGKLEILNDETLAGESSVSLTADEFSSTLLIPLVGKVKYSVDGVSYGASEAGQMHLIAAPAGSVVEITNPYVKDLVNFLHIQVITGERPQHVLVRKFDFDIDTKKNTLLHFEPPSTSEAAFPRVTIAKFDGRHEAMLTIREPAKGAFVFVIEGAFEVENRLLQARDGLAITKTDSVELEALSNGAVVLVVE
ncbi:MAG TPA: hypothetical protein VG737_02085 [Cyclobacteriaceae bacterium]|nr:hypothetical protein [Cyclobacteriaceae bacterium]